MWDADISDINNSDAELLRQVLINLSEPQLMGLILDLGQNSPISMALQARASSLRSNIYENGAESNIQEILRNAREINKGFRREFFDEVIKFTDRAQMTDPQVYNRAGINRALWYRMRDNRDARTSKRNVLKIALVLHLNYWELYYLISLAGYSFLPYNDTTDYVVSSCVLHGIYEDAKIDEFLIENGAAALFAEE